MPSHKTAFGSRKSSRDPIPTDHFSPPEEPPAKKQQTKPVVSAQEEATRIHRKRSQAFRSLIAKHPTVVQADGLDVLQKSSFFGCTSLIITDVPLFHSLLTEMIVDDNDGIWPTDGKIPTFAVYSMLRRSGFLHSGKRAPQAPSGDMMWFSVFRWSLRNLKVANKFSALSLDDVVAIADRLDREEAQDEDHGMEIEEPAKDAFKKPVEEPVENTMPFPPPIAPWISSVDFLHDVLGGSGQSGPSTLSLLSSAKGKESKESTEDNFDALVRSCPVYASYAPPEFSLRNSYA